MTTENKQTKSFSERLKQTPKQWIKVSVWSLIYILFIIWVGNFWWLLLLPVIFDAFITKYVPWSWWKGLKNKPLLSVMGWVDAIAFALVAVYFINTYLFQNYQIPTSSLEKTLLVGDFLFVSKASYGPRVPNTPLSFPLVQHTFPLINTKSYFEKPQWEYKRLKGFDTIERNDIVVFNFPTGDTVPVKLINMTTDDYYATSYKIGQNVAAQNNLDLSENPNKRAILQSFGRDYIKNHPGDFGEIIWRPVDRRENYVKRCVGTPGDTLEIRNNKIFVNGKAEEKHAGVQYNYFVQTDGTLLNENIIQKLGISKQDGDPKTKTVSNPQLLTALGLDPALPAYHFPLTEEMYNNLQKVRGVNRIVIEPSWMYESLVFPVGGGKPWTRDNYGPVYIPKRGASIKLTLEDLPVYERIISVYENNKLEVRDSVIYINDQIAAEYTFKMDYFWMMGDNRHNSLDSRYWGFVPEDHVVGRPVFVWLSLDKDKSLFGGKIRWNRFFKNATK
ncbi:MAG: S26 family signal peptidase [Prevotellaceae bacterium]|jgi:signal peptidase I|nr:S26 family signal peptidase [Prevotellaceae bacterium]